MGEAEDSEAEAHDLSGRAQADSGGTESTVGEGEARLRTRHSRGGLPIVPGKREARVVKEPSKIDAGAMGEDF